MVSQFLFDMWLITSHANNQRDVPTPHKYLAHLRVLSGQPVEEYSPHAAVNKCRRFKLLH
jgi:hypothetical protein